MNLKHGKFLVGLLLIALPTLGFSAAPIAVDAMRGTVQNTPLTIDVVANYVKFINFFTQRGIYFQFSRNE